MLVVVWLAAALGAIQVLRPNWTAAPFLGGLVNLFASAAMAGALFRIGVEARHPGDAAFRAHAAGLQWGSLEWRVLGARIILGLIFLAAIFVVAIIWGVAVGVSAMADRADVTALTTGDNAAKGAAALHMLAGPAGVISVAIWLPTLAAALYFGARLSLYPLLAADTRAFNFAQSWRTTRGAVMAIVVTWIVSFLAQMLLAVVVGGMLGAIAAMLGHSGAARGWGSIGGQAASVAIAGPLAAGLQLYIYNALGSGDTAATFA